MKLLVMGAGYVGMALLDYLQGQSHEIFITTTKKERVEPLKLYGEHVLLLDPHDHGELAGLINQCDGMVILIAPNQSQTYEEVYLEMAKKICSALKDRKKPFYLLYTSSTSVCEGLKNMWVTEEIALFPKSEKAKILLEAESLYLNSGVKACVLRLGGIYGPNRSLAERARRFSGKEMAGTGEEETNHIHLEDIVHAIAFCFNHALTGLYHLVNDDHPTKRELYSKLCQSLKIPNPKWHSAALPKGQGGYKVSNRKIKEAGFSFVHPHIW